ncbi:MAG: hypothetical protein A3J50_03150 [Candidatus Woykebacteria bacterium RIFCSPHIGHO2_02_FULL_43_16b]|uniref:Uncharacterized protein n=1 Tax=Candidatus Woykebacteria bacterium RIFCSPHIGHO2_02_FULL_43_16b TaxID=1802601 RepID=A0A1G1WP22_9BACT|nr:MAG: hypothetical protein A3J50_03150 [Candidatus Woykebacteria bacterium RIFCSPHIGHO2_02_FULL_43_16b]
MLGFVLSRKVLLLTLLISFSVFFRGFYTTDSFAFSIGFPFKVFNIDFPHNYPVYLSKPDLATTLLNAFIAWILVTTILMLYNSLKSGKVKIWLQVFLSLSSSYLIFTNLLSLTIIFTKVFVGSFLDKYSPVTGMFLYPFTYIYNLLVIKPIFFLKYLYLNYLLKPSDLASFEVFNKTELITRFAFVISTILIAAIGTYLFLLIKNIEEKDSITHGTIHNTKSLYIRSFILSMLIAGAIFTSISILFPNKFP